MHAYRVFKEGKGYKKWKIASVNKSSPKPWNIIRKLIPLSVHKTRQIHIIRTMQWNIPPILLVLAMTSKNTFAQSDNIMHWCQEIDFWIKMCLYGKQTTTQRKVLEECCWHLRDLRHSVNTHSSSGSRQKVKRMSSLTEWKLVIVQLLIIIC